MRIETRRWWTPGAALGMALLALGLVATAGRADRADRRDTRSEDFSWSGPVARGKTVDVRGLNGDIHAEPASGGEVSITAVKHARRSDPSSVRIEVSPGPDGVTVCALYPGMESCDEHVHRHQDDNDVEVDFTVKVPAGVRLVASTVNGGVEAVDLDGPVDASTVNGGIDLSTRGEAHAETVNGSVSARVGSLDWEGTLEFKSVNGGVEVELPARIKAVLAASTTNGSIHSDFPVTVEGTLSPHKLRGTIGGGGGGELRLTTVNGDIRLLSSGHGTSKHDTEDHGSDE